MTNYATAATHFDPPDPTTATPSAVAETCSRGRWHRAPHLDIIEQACLQAINSGQGVILSVAVRHGKSEYASHWLPTWYLGRNPDKRIILATHEATFARTWGRRVRDTVTEHGPTHFGIAPARGNAAANEWGIQNHSGGMLTVGVGGAPIGRGANLIIVDDPFANWQDGTSPLRQRQVQEWWTGTMESRREPGAAVIIICARWHENDLSGFLLDSAPNEWTEIRLPALCDDPDNDPLGRAEGEPLWPERYNAAALEKARRATSITLGTLVWDAQYQQSPSTPDGGMFTLEWPLINRAAAEAASTGSWVRRWDLAATAQGGDWTVGVLATQHTDGRTIIADVVAGQWAPDDVRIQLVGCAATDPPGTRIVIPQDPGQAGKDQAQQLTRLLAPHQVQAVPETGSKETRAAGLAAQQRAGNVLLVEAGWNRSFIAELAAFPRAKHDDQVDAAAGAFNSLHTGSGEAAVVQYRRRAGR